MGYPPNVNRHTPVKTVTSHVSDAGGKYEITKLLIVLGGKVLWFQKNAINRKFPEVNVDVCSGFQDRREE